MNITNDKQKRALLIYQAGPENQEIFETLTDTGDCMSSCVVSIQAFSMALEGSKK